MKPFKARTSIRSVEGEIIHRIPLQNDFSIWVYSTVSPKTGYSRERGADAIRTVLMYKNRKAVMRESKTLRTTTWEKNLRQKIEDLTNRTTEYKCPWGHGLVRRPGKKGKGSFYGCSMFPECRYTYKGEKRLSEVYDPKKVPPTPEKKAK
ncbi:MAG: topoisomerase DNA-binding C4 zinc finger domain-containing protein [Candidatus Thorarchaeota archaeon]|nr:MAG: topoisomerase DNA-binding C4 zinc finger domain-containing protein [Candidatus Thorarchaeota archaeon]